MSQSSSLVIWVVVNAQGPIQAYEDREQAEEFAAQLGARVVSCGLLLSRETESDD